MSETSCKLNFLQVFGSSSTFKVRESDIITSVRFSPDGKYIAVGDHGGRLVIFKYNDRGLFEFMTEFQSHNPAFDPLKSQDISEKINDCCFFYQGRPDKIQILSTNDKTIKTFDIPLKNSFDEPPKHVVDYAKGHHYHIHSVKVTADNSHFFSADDLRINLWDISRNDTCFTLVDNKPSNLSNLSEVISAFDVSPTDSSIFAYSTSSGLFTICDMRSTSIFNRDSALMFEDQTFEAPSKSNLPTITEAISSIRFSHNGQKIAIRDYLCTKVWDIRNSYQPESIIPVHNQVIPDLNELYDKEIIFDNFEVNWSFNDKFLLSGSYSNRFMLCDTGGEWALLTEAKRFTGSKGQTMTPSLTQGIINASLLGGVYTMKNFTVLNDKLPLVTDYDRKIICCDASPKSDIYAVATLNNLFLYTLV